MFGSQALETVIGLVFFFLAISIFVTSVQEFIATALALRSATLDKGLQQLVAQGGALNQVGQALLDHPDVSPTRAKAYVTAVDFSHAVVDVLSEGNPAASFDQISATIGKLPDGPLKTAAIAAAARAQGQLTQFEQQLSTWFDNSMENLSSKYKRFSGYLSLGLGAVLAFLFNLDAIHITRALWVSDALREQTVAVAAAEAAKSAPGTVFIPADHTLDAFGFHVNWFDASWGFSGLAFFGCAITAFAISLGAPFWFDILQNLMNLRGTGAKPARTDAPEPSAG